jgi:hypothetical protein
LKKWLPNVSSWLVESVEICGFPKAMKFGGDVRWGFLDNSIPVRFASELDNLEESNLN